MNKKADQPPTRGVPDVPKATYEPPQLKKYGSLAELTRSGTGTRMENNMGPNTRFS